jgi:dTDP-4-dehydrorhamnose reductase
MSEIRVLVLGALGMLGHRLMRTLPAMGYDVTGAVRRIPLWSDPPWKLIELEATRPEELPAVIDQAAPDVVVNAIGWVSQRSIEGRVREAIQVNAVFPHHVARACAERGIGLLHVSTDCAGEASWYGVSKKWGEELDHGLVLRTSFIGHELGSRRGLLEWALSQRGRVTGYAGVIWHGLTTNELASIFGRHLIPGFWQFRGRLDVAGPAITKYELLRRINLEYELGLEVQPVLEPTLERRLDRQPFEAASGYRVPPWDEMLVRMKRERPIRQEAAVA